MKKKSFLFSELSDNEPDLSSNLVFCGFDRTNPLDELYSKLDNQFPNAQIVSFSTSGHFIGPVIEDRDPVIISLEFENSHVETHSLLTNDFADSVTLGEALGGSVEVDGLKGLCVLSDGTLVNGTELIHGINKSLVTEVPIFGGMAGDGTRFEKTLSGLNKQPSEGNVIAIAFYGENLEITGACNTGWSYLGIDFEITKSDENKLIEIDNQNPYDILYDLLKPENKDDFTKNTLYHPFLLELEDDISVIRTPILVDHENKTLTYAGNMPEGCRVKLMKSGTIQLLDATLEAAKNSMKSNKSPDFVFAVSCVGRRVVLDDMANEEYTELNSVFGDNASYFGFYSYGEFYRTGRDGICMLHNQTFTLASITEN